MSVTPVEDLVRPMPWSGRDPEPLLTHEWLVTNGLGGYASGTVAGVSTRRYHGLLVAALPDPHGRTVVFNHLFEHLHLSDGTNIQLGSEERAGERLELAVARILQGFQLETGLPVWRYQVGDVLLEKRLLLPHRQNTVHITYRLLAGNGSVRIRLRPSVHFRRHEAAVNDALGSYVLTTYDSRYEVAKHSSELPPLRLHLHGQQAMFTVDAKEISQVVYRVEESRGYEYSGSLW
ncbi:MAG TPA: glycogen debranching enzyme N-terminal domain-containing protein, partial [Gemmataceae bacterium]|nr:glycogen debranching enzyme N-terminal domain-containing protein [Gemmataceae bacterium]